ncbi:unnamed protein product, partial [marine sediment metagenome]
ITREESFKIKDKLEKELNEIKENKKGIILKAYQEAEKILKVTQNRAEKIIENLYKKKILSKKSKGPLLKGIKEMDEEIKINLMPEKELIKSRDIKIDDYVLVKSLNKEGVVLPTINEPLTKPNKAPPRESIQEINNNENAFFKNISIILAIRYTPKNIRVKPIMFDISLLSVVCRLIYSPTSLNQKIARKIAAIIPIKFIMPLIIPRRIPVIMFNNIIIIIDTSIQFIGINISYLLSYFSRKFGN